MKTYTVAVLGATGAVGQEMIKILEERNFPVGKLVPLASARSAGKTLRFRGEDVVIRIRDYGPGIPEEELPHVKYKFYKGSSKARGSGIGLAVCEEIITRHGGTLELANAEGGGCVAIIRLPTDKQ